MLLLAAAPAAAAPPVAKETPAPAGWTPVTLNRVFQRDVASTHTGQTYRIFLSVPVAPPPAEGYPVLYALDGNATFLPLAMMSRTVARRSKVTGVLPAVVVGIGYPSGEDFDGPARTKDYTLPAGANLAPGEGGADRFLDFLEQELKPLIQAGHKIDRRRQALFGHSYGGLFVLHALFTRPTTFQAFIASSPSIWWHDRFVLTELPKLREQAPRLDPLPRLLVTVGELEQPTVNVGHEPPDRLELLKKRRMVDSARELTATLRADSRWADRVAAFEFSGEDHGSAMFPALCRALPFFLAGKN
jgi:predicted alpha/beta superfamily hydrolase